MTIIDLISCQSCASRRLMGPQIPSRKWVLFILVLRAGWWSGACDIVCRVVDAAGTLYDLEAATELEDVVA